jgi:hypothetical protein
MRPACVFANSPPRELEQLHDRLRGPWRQGLRAVMVLPSLHGLPAGEIAVLLECHPATVRRWIGRSTARGWPGWPTGPGAGGPGWAGAA